MSTHIPILEFIHDLRAAGVVVTYDDFVSRPQAYWDQLSEGKRALICAKHQLESEEPLQVQVVRRRASGAGVENVFVRMGAGTSGSPFARAYESLLYGGVAVDVKDGTSEGFEAGGDPVIEERFRSGGPAKLHHRRMLDVLDQAWGGDAYDLTRDGILHEFIPADDETELERYEVEPDLASIVVVSDTQNKLLYHVVEPELSEFELSLAAALNERLRDALVLDEADEERDEARHVVDLLFDLMRTYRYRLDRRSSYKLGYYFLRNYLGFARLEPLMRDPHIEDISCNGPDLPLYVVHTRHQSIQTNILFDEMELNNFTIKLAQRGGKLLSIAQPIVDATLPDGSRIQASLGREVTSRGSAFTIRKFREEPLTAVDLIRGRTHSLDSMALLWLMVEMKRSLVIMGATASGKTTTLNCLSQFIPPTSKIVTIEDTREITLQHENWLAAVTREAFTGEEAERVSMYDLLRAALRQRPEYIIVGEIRGQEGLTLFQAMSTGHTCFSTMHAGSVENAVYRLENPPIGVPRVMLTSLDLFAIQAQVDVGGRHERRMISLSEINGIDPSTRNLRMNEVFKWNAETDTLEAANPSYVLEQLRAKRGWSRGALEENLAERRRVLAGLVERGERNYRQVASAVADFYLRHANAPVLPAKKVA